MDPRLGTLGIDGDAVPGVVVVWSGGEPRCAGHRVPAFGIRLDRSLVPWDGIDLALELTSPRSIRVTDRGSGLTIDRRPAIAATIDRFPTVIRTTGSVLVVVADVRPFENVTPIRAGSLTIAGSLGPLARTLDAAANAEEHASIKGPRAVVRELALRYASRLGAHAWFRPSGDQHLDHILATRENIRTIILDLSRPIDDFDIDTIHRVLETDLRFVVVREGDHYLKWLPPALAAFPLLVVPEFRPDELAFAIQDRNRERLADGLVEPGAVAPLLDHARRNGEDALLEALAIALGNREDSDRRELRERDLPRGVG